MKKYFFLALLIVACNTVLAQMGMGKPENIKEIAEKPLLVVLQHESPETVKKLSKKPEELQAFRNSIAAYNAALKAAFTREWKFSKDVRFVSGRTYDSIANDEQEMKRYAYFMMDWQYLSSHDKIRRSVLYNFEFGLPYKELPVYYLPICGPSATEGDIVYMLEQTLIYFEYRLLDKDKSWSESWDESMAEIDARTPLIKNRILLIEKDAAYEALIKNIAAIYSYKYELCSKDVIEKAIINHDPAYAYVRSIPSPGALDPCDLVYTQYVINPEDGTIMFILGSDSKPKIAKSDINKLAKKLKKLD